MGLHVDEWGTRDWLLVDDDTSSLGESLVNTTDDIIRGLDFAQEDWFLEAWRGSELASVDDSSGGWDDLTTTSVDSISVESDIIDIDSDTSHVLIAHGTLSGGPLEGSFHGVLDFTQELDTLGDIDQDVWTVGVWTERPDLLGIVLLPSELFENLGVAEHLGSLLDFILWTDFLSLDQIRKLITNGSTLAEESVVLVWRFGEAHLGGLVQNGFLIGDDWVSLLDFALSVLLNKILQADLDMELTATGNDMLTRFFSGAKNEWIGFGEFLETFDEFWKIVGVLDIDGNSDDWRDRVLHDPDVVSLLVGGDGTLLEKILIDTDETDSVSARNIWDGLDFTTHHDDGSLDALNVQVGLASWLVVWTLDSDLLSSSNGTGENSTESVESTLISRWDHLGDEDAKLTILVAVLDRGGSGVILWTFVKVSSSVLLGLNWGWELEDDHFNECLGSIDPLLEDTLHEMLSFESSLIRLEGKLKGNQHFVDFIHLTIHGGSAESDDWLHHELDEGSLEFRSIFAILGYGPNLLL